MFTSLIHCLIPFVRLFYEFLSRSTNLYTFITILSADIDCALVEIVPLQNGGVKLYRILAHTDVD